MDINSRFEIKNLYQVYYLIKVEVKKMVNNKLRIFGVIFLMGIIFSVACEPVNGNNNNDLETTKILVTKTEIPVLKETVMIPTATPEPAKKTEVLTPGVLTPTSGIKMLQYQVVGQNIADNTKVLPDQLVTITWAIKNIGTVGWTSQYSIRYFSGVVGKQNIYYFPPTVAVGKVANISAIIVAPTNPGNYNSWWKLTNEKGQNFGDIDFSFVVGN